MSIDYIEKLPSADELKSEIPLGNNLSSIKKDRDEEIKQVLMGNSSKFILVIGPCSAHNPDAVCDYVTRLAKLQQEVIDKIIIIPRVYTNKPRTTGEGYKGIAHQADLDEDPNFAEGMKAMRRMHVKVLAESRLAAADEMLYPGNYPYLDDILCYVAVGARSVENQEHRLTISGLDVAAGMKNPTSGDIEIMLNSVHAAQLPHDFIYNGYRVKTSGNPLAHCIMRGSVNQYGRSFPNYHFEDLMRLSETYATRKLLHPAVLVDTNHSNSGKQYQQQPRIAKEILRAREHSSVIHTMVKGLMIESYIQEGFQAPTGGEYGQSITDPCLGWDDTASLVKDIAYSL